jgi:hypothetical protein
MITIEHRGERTRLGHRLEAKVVDGDPNRATFGFMCRTRTFVLLDGSYAEADPVFAQLFFYVPTTRESVERTIRAWVSAYGDAELVDSVAPVVDAVFSKLAERASATGESGECDGPKAAERTVATPALTAAIPAPRSGFTH